MPDTGLTLSAQAALLLGMETADALLEWLCNEAEIRVLAYCRRSEMLPEMVPAAARMAARAYRREDDLTALREGDAQMTFRETDWREALQPFRKLRKA